MKLGGRAATIGTLDCGIHAGGATIIGALGRGIHEAGGVRGKVADGT